MKTLKGILIVVGILVTISSPGTSDFETFNPGLNPHPHSMLQLLLIALGGMALVYIGYKLPSGSGQESDEDRYY